MTQIRHRLWTLAREPEGPLAWYLDSFAESLDAAGFKPLLISRQIRIAADFSAWLASHAIHAESVSDDYVRQFLGSLTHRLAVRQGGAAALRRLVDFLRRRGICSAPKDPGKATAIQGVVAEYANHLRDDQAWQRVLAPTTARSLNLSCQSDSASGLWPSTFCADWTLLSSCGERQLSSVRQERRQLQPPYGPSCATFAIVGGRSMTWPVLCRPCPTGQ